MKEELLVLAILVIVALLLLASLPLSSYQCKSRWPDYETSYGLVQGCLVKNNGKWIPDDGMRAVDQ